MFVEILKYFTLKHRSSLPSPHGPLSKVVPSEGISLANKEAKEVLEAEDYCHVPSGNSSGSGYSRGLYEHLSTDEKAKIGKTPAEIGVAATEKS